MKVILHINELAKWSGVLSNVTNLLTDGKGLVISVEVLANGEAVKGYQEASLGIEMHELVERGVQLSCCQHAMDRFGIKAEELPPFIQVVPAGVLRLVECQSNGYAYIKP